MASALPTDLGSLGPSPQNVDRFSEDGSASTRAAGALLITRYRTHHLLEDRSFGIVLPGKGKTHGRQEQ
jgi:hypothetical protein